ncbi:MAG: PTS system mannose/fructose/sorbose family transporter subunit IID [Erysipelotrichaceae bacterium]|nr:PTS system mannose/fructose/sorbose family transporter subunit IID [Erysipelotrichaceae bacterium]
MAEKKITQADINSVYWRSFYDMGAINYERFQSLGYLFAFQKVFHKLYDDDPAKMKRALKRHLEMFNTMPLLIPPIQGTTLALEEKIANAGPDEDTTELEDSVNNIKVGLMGPFAGIGDSLGWGTFRPIACSIGASMAAAGSVLGPIVTFIIWNVFNFAFRYISLVYGYKMGTSMLSTIKSSNIVDKISTGASVLGLMVLGVLTASWVSLNTGLQITVTGNAYVTDAAGNTTLQEGVEITTKIQEVLDGLIPSILPLCLVMFMASLMKKGWTTTKLIVLVFAIALVSTLIAQFTGVVIFC